MAKETIIRGEGFIMHDGSVSRAACQRHVESEEVKNNRAKRHARYLFLLFLLMGRGIYGSLGVDDPDQSINLAARSGADVVGTASVNGSSRPQAACNTGLKLAIGDVDPRFEISPEETAEAVRSAIELWNAAAGATIVSLDPNAKVKIHFSFGETQSEINRLQGFLKIIYHASDTYDAKEREAASRFTEFERQFSEYREKREKYDAYVENWNTQGGAPTEIYNSLERERIELDEQRTLLRERAAFGEYDADSLEARRVEYNAFLEKIRLMEGEGEEISGEYIYQRGVVPSIQIRAYTSKEQLIILLTHEIGHALGIGHVDAEGSVMYRVLPNGDDIRLGFSPADRAALNACREG